jgi:hypothetical protein
MLKNGNNFSEKLVRAPLDVSSGAVSGLSNDCSGGGRKAGGSAPLGMYGSIVVKNDAPPAWQEGRKALYSLARHASKLLFPKGTEPNLIKGVGTCRWALQYGASGVGVKMSHYADQHRAHLTGLQTCKSVWDCPVCSSRISRTRGQQASDVLSWARAEGHRVVMITLTARHTVDDPLADFLKKMKKAKRKLHGRQAWRKLKKRDAIVSVLTAVEVTHGRHGWHPHFHMIVIVRDEDAEGVMYGLGDTWRDCLRTEGLDGKDAAFDCRDANQAGKYLAKWGAAQELTLSGQKRARKGGITPLQLLEASKAGNEGAGDHWLEYSRAFFGSTQLDGLTAACRLAGLDEVSDEEAASDEGQEDQTTDEEPTVVIDPTVWRKRGRYRRTDIMDACEKGGALAVQRVLEVDTPQEPDDTVIEAPEQLSASQFNDLVDEVEGEILRPVPKSAPVMISDPPPIIPDSIRDMMMRSIWTPDDVDQFVDFLAPDKCCKAITPAKRAEAILRTRSRSAEKCG